jgi:hypothetical protein
MFFYLFGFSAKPLDPIYGSMDQIPIERIVGHKGLTARGGVLPGADGFIPRHPLKHIKIRRQTDLLPQKTNSIGTSSCRIKLTHSNIGNNNQCPKHPKQRFVLVKSGRDNLNYIIPDSKARDKFYHALDFGIEMPPSLDLEYVKTLDYRERLAYLRNTSNLPPSSVELFQQAIRSHVMDPKTEKILGTLGANQEAKGIGAKTEGVFFYNSETNIFVFFEKPTHRFRTGMRGKENQIEDLQRNGNIL